MALLVRGSHNQVFSKLLTAVACRNWKIDTDAQSYPIVGQYKQWSVLCCKLDSRMCSC